MISVALERAREWDVTNKTNKFHYKRHEQFYSFLNERIDFFYILNYYSKSAMTYNFPWWHLDIKKAYNFFFFVLYYFSILHFWWCLMIINNFLVTYLVCIELESILLFSITNHALFPLGNLVAYNGLFHKLFF